MWAKIKEKILEHILWPIILIIITSFFTGSYLSSNYFVNLIVSKQYWMLFIVSSITIVIGILAVSLCYFFIYVLKKKLEKYYLGKEKYLSYYKLKSNVKKETKTQKISGKEFFSIGDRNNDDIVIEYKRSDHIIELELVNISKDAFVEIIFNPILKEDHIKKHIEHEKLKQLNYLFNKENIVKYIEHYEKFKEEIDDIIFSMDDNTFELKESMFNVRNTIFKNKIMDGLLEKTIDKYRVISEINHMKFDFEENYIDENSEFVIKFYFKNKMIDQKIIKLANFFKNENMNIEFSQEILKNI